MLAIFNKGMVNPPQELNSPASLSSSKRPKFPEQILRDFATSNPTNAFAMSFPGASLAYIPQQSSYTLHQRLFCGLNDLYCIFLGSLNNLCSLIRQYGLSSKGTNEATFIIEAYRTLRDRGPFPAHQVLKDLEGTFAFVVFDVKTGHVFVAQGENEGVKLYWGIAADGSVVISDELEVIKGSCAKSFAPFPAGCMFHSEQGLMSFEHPTNKMKAMPRVDSEGVMCGANFKVDVHSTTNRGMPRVGSEANWALSGSHA